MRKGYQQALRIVKSADLQRVKESQIILFMEDLIRKIIDLETDEAHKALCLTSNDRHLAAKLLGISHRTLRYWIKKREMLHEFKLGRGKHGRPRKVRSR